jgi:carboxyl-terminal processing protease
MSESYRKILVITIILSLAVGFGGGFWFKGIKDKDRADEIIKEIINREDGAPKGVDFGLFWQVWDTLHAKYVDKNTIDARKALYGAISGMVSSIGDPYTVFFEPVDSKKFKEEIQGEFGGVGMEIAIEDGGLTVVSPLKGTPAFRAGLQAGDKITKVDDRLTAGMSIDEAVNLIRGKKGTKVVLTIARNGSVNEVELTRDRIKIPTIDWQLLDGHVAYLQIYSFNQNVDSDFADAVKEILKSDVDRLIVDVRNNPGGLLDSAVNLAGWFLEKDSIVTIEDFGNGVINEFRTDGSASLKDLKTVVLLNGGSASASEILAGALHDNRSTTLIGQNTFGKGSVQQLENFYDGSSLKVTIAKWLTPSGISISDEGIKADIEVEISKDAIESDEIEIGTPGKDPQLDKALEIVNNL